MEWILILKGMVVGLAASAPLGPIGVLCVQRTINKGRTVGFVSGMGAAFADTVFAAIAGLGLSMIIEFIREQQLYFEIIGVALLIFIGARIFYSNPIKQYRRSRKEPPNLFGDFISMMGLTLSNPMAIFLFLALFAGLGLINKGANFFLTTQILVGVFAGASLWWFMLSTFVNILRDKFRLRRIWWINKIAGTAIFVFALFAIVGMFFIN